MPAGRSCRHIVLSKIVSGGQTGVDRGALDAALAASFPCGGWCPEDRQAEDGAIPTRYPVQVLPTADYRKRTRQNVIDSDGTLIIHFGALEGGTAATLRLCESYGKPVMVLRGDHDSPDRLARTIMQFLTQNSIRVLNVAGPRESKYVEAGPYAQRIVSELIALVASEAPNQAPSLRQY